MGFFRILACRNKYMLTEGAFELHSTPWVKMIEIIFQLSYSYSKKIELTLVQIGSVYESIL